MTVYNKAAVGRAAKEKGFLRDTFKDAVLTLGPMEIFAAKANALMSIAAARVLYDFNNMIEKRIFSDKDREMFRKSIIRWQDGNADEKYCL